MAAKKIRNELESVRSDIRELAQAVWALRDELTAERAVAAAERQRARAAHPDDGPIERGTRAAGGGSISLTGTFAPEHDEAGRGVHWSLREQPVAELASGPTEARAQVLAAIGHRQRLAILLQLLTRPATAAELVRALTLGTTGAAYHHLNVLQAAGLVEQRQRGRFAVTPMRIPLLVTILAAMSGEIEITALEPAHPSPSADGDDPQSEALAGAQPGTTDTA